MKIAIVYFKYIDSDDTDVCISESITDWAEVTEEDYELLCVWVDSVNKKQGFHGDRDIARVIVRMENDELPKLIELCKIAAMKDAEEKEKRRKENEEKKRLRMLARKNKTKDAELKLLKELHDKYGSELGVDK